MSTLLTIVSLGLAVILIGLFAHNLITRRYDVLSWRNLFLLGFFHFYALGGYLTMVNPGFAWRFNPTERSIARLAWLSPLFVLVFYATARWAYQRWWGRRLFPPLNLPPTGSGLLLTSIILIGAGLAFSVIPPGGYLGLLAVQFKGGMASTAVGLAAFYLISKRFSPLAWATFLTALGAAAIVTTVGGSGRRALLAALIVGPWMWYWFVLRYRNASGLVLKIGALGVAGLVILAAYGNVRQKGGGAAGVSAKVRGEQALELIKNPNVSKRSFDLMLYTDTVTNTLYILEHYPDDLERVPFNGVAFILSNPIPRAIWPEKPVALGIQIQNKMNTAANLGPGIIGHGWAEGGVIGVILYAIFFGLFIGFGDAALRDRAMNPYFVAVMGAGLGNMIGLPRGDTALFLLQILAAMISSAVALYTIGLVFRPYMSMTAPLIVGEAPWMAPDDGEAGSTAQDASERSGAAA